MSYPDLKPDEKRYVEPSEETARLYYGGKPHAVCLTRNSVTLIATDGSGMISLSATDTILERLGLSENPVSEPRIEVPWRRAEAFAVEPSRPQAAPTGIFGTLRRAAAAAMALSP